MPHRIGFCFALLALGWSATLATAQEVPVVVAVDTSRSLSAADLEALRGAIGQTVDQLSQQLPLGLLVFNDEARWLVPPGGGRDQVLSALAGIKPQGRYTVLNDALFLAARDLSDGGVVLVVTDGRDENSATTAEDVARMCESHHVRLVAASLGRRVDERALRRLALLSHGELVGGVSADTPAAAARAVEQARTSVAAERIARTPPATPVQPPVAALPVEPARPAARLPVWLLPVLAVLGVALAVALWLALRRRHPDQRTCDNCGALLDAWETSCPHCQVSELQEAARSQQVAAPVAAPAPAPAPAPREESLLDPDVFRKAPLPAGLEGLEHTLVLDEQAVLTVRQRGKSARSYTLPKDQLFAVGRAPEVNSLQVDDPTVSAQHFRVVPKDGEFYVVDLDTTNGTLVNHERVKVRKLASGDLIQVGGVQLEFSLQLRRLG
jgi:hypothetical protein